VRLGTPCSQTLSGALVRFYYMLIGLLFVQDPVQIITHTNSRISHKKVPGQPNCTALCPLVTFKVILLTVTEKKTNTVANITFFSEVTNERATANECDGLYTTLLMQAGAVYYQNSYYFHLLSNQHIFLGLLHVRSCLSKLNHWDCRAALSQTRRHSCHINSNDKHWRKQAPDT